MIRLLVIDNHASAGKRTKKLLEQEKDFHVTVLHSGKDALALIREQKFDILLFDLRMPILSWQVLVKKATENDSETIVILYTNDDIEPYFNLIIESGVSSFVSKTASKAQLIATIRAALQGDAVIPIKFLPQLRKIKTRKLGTIYFNRKEINILKQVSYGKTNKEIADVVFLSPRTVEYHLTNIFKKLGVDSRTKAVMKASELGYIEAIR
ncbi:response regulator transcription factor [Bacillus chungangensis]|uniref:Two-component system competent response regulator ComA n=1 Tax=Bacillus chungangensis TaxID=587633 RepID=A0ABT9WTP7_9BACI|nr:response regulator transcription factor [Bacillus chungangensis]MDQ0176115.1 two-component system competent response regulator ComA [Bacillus chungangensis]